MMDHKADDRCENCGLDFADHEYIKDSITDYQCPHDDEDWIYGFFHGGDPRDFHPDAESCSQEELSAHKLACEFWNQAASLGEKPDPEKCPSGYIYDDDGKCIGHVLRSRYGIGTYCMRTPQFFEPMSLPDDPDQTYLFYDPDED